MDNTLFKHLFRLICGPDKLRLALRSVPVFAYEAGLYSRLHFFRDNRQWLGTGDRYKNTVYSRIA